MSIKLSKLGEQATIIMGQSPPGESYNKHGIGVPLLNGPTEFGSLHPKEIQWTTSPKKLCKLGDILFCVRGATAGRLNLADKEYCLGRGLAAIRGKSGKFDSRFLRYVLSNGYASFQARGVGSTFINISREELAGFEVPVLPLMEQRHVADILDRAEALRAKRRATLAQLDELIKSIFIDMFGDPRSLTEEKNVKLKLRDVINIIVPTRDKPKSFTGNIPWITLPDLTNSMYIEDSKQKLSKEEAKPTKARLFPKETVILSCAGSLGKVAIAVNEVFTNQQFYGLVCDKKKIIPEFLAYYLLLLDEDYYRGISGTSILAFFKKESALNIEIILPDISDQIHFSQIVKKIERIKQSQLQSSFEISNLLDALLHQAFTGKLFSHQCFDQQIETV